MMLDRQALDLRRDMEGTLPHLHVKSRRVFVTIWVSPNSFTCSEVCLGVCR